MPQHQALDLNNMQRLVTTEPIPDTCPTCHRAIQPRQLAAQYVPRNNQVQVIYRCTSGTCEETFVATYTGVPNQPGVYRLNRTAPSRPRPVQIPPNVTAISPTFVEISNQVAHAESEGLSQLVGLGLRKALEFLVKDYLVHKHPGHPDAIEAIKRKFLGACINEDIDDPRVKTCAARATWLGNDETHYVRKWDSKDVTDLKRLISLTVNWIDSSLQTEEYEKSMPA